MKNLIVIEQNIDVSNILAELEASPELWNLYTGRTDDPNSPHNRIADIWLRFADKSLYAPCDHDRMSDPHESIWYSAIDKLPSVKNLVMEFAGRLQSERLGGVIITRLPAGTTISPHVDDDWHSQYYKKFHVLLQGKGSIIYSGDEHLVPKAGEMFYLNDKEIHGVVNASGEDRIALVFCVRQDQGARVGGL